MAKGGGGAWKVAYADFVTAMMAFFLVMWICSQDQKIKQAVARYFVTPMGLVETGVSKKPNHAGAIMSGLISGSVPTNESVSLGRGRVSHTRPDNDYSTATRVIGEWLQGADSGDYWLQEAHSAREHARMTRELLETPGSVDETAALQLSRRLRERISRNVHSDQGDLTHELLSHVLADVNWIELAEDLLADPKGAPAREKMTFRTP